MNINHKGTAFMHTKEHSGLLIAVEGIDGSGKSSLAQALANSLQTEYATLLTKEPGGTPVGQELRTMVQTGRLTNAVAEYLIFGADRAEHFAQVVIPALNKGMIVISDRTGDSSLVYQGYGRGIDRSMISMVNSWATQGYTPDITLFVDVPLAVAQERWHTRNQGLSAFEQEQTDFMQRVQEGFYALYKNRSDVILVDGTQSRQDMLTYTIASLHPWIEKYAHTNRTGTLMAGQP